VRIAEIDRNITRQLGINWTALANFGHFNAFAGISDGLSAATNLPNTIGAGWANGTSAINTVLDLLAQDQLITMLAEPNLTARSGETASFLAGGEFPIPIAASNGTITVQFKQYGVSLAFVPTVLSDGRISLHVRPEVSELSSQGAVSLPVSTGLLGTNTITIPAITVRRADTTVELGSGQSFAVAGLLQTQDQNTTRGLPYLGELPVIGTLFKSNMFLNNKSELVIVVTPYIVGPVSLPGGLRTPADDFVPAGDVGRNLFLRQRARGTGPNVQANGATGRATPASAGFMLP
jgi:pilus assembly protein CpaC